MPEQTFQQVTDAPADGPWAVFRRDANPGSWVFVNQYPNEGAANLAAAELVGAGPTEAQVLSPTGDRFTSI